MKVFYFILIFLAIYVALNCFYPTDITHKTFSKPSNKVEGYYNFVNNDVEDPEVKKELIDMIRDNYLDLNFTFNPSDQPVTTRYLSLQDQDFVLFYKDTVTRQVDTWRKDIKVIDVRPLVIYETLKDFILDSIVKFKYKNNIFDLEVKYYGTRDRTDNIFDLKNTYTFQLIDIRSSSTNVAPKPNLDDTKTLDLTPVNFRSSLTDQFLAERKRMHDSEKYDK